MRENAKMSTWKALYKQDEENHNKKGAKTKEFLNNFGVSEVCTSIVDDLRCAVLFAHISRVVAAFVGLGTRDGAFQRDKRPTSMSFLQVQPG